MYRKIKTQIKKAVLANRVTRYSYALLNTLFNGKRHAKVYHEYINEPFTEVALPSGNIMSLYKSDKKSEMYFNKSAYDDILNSIWDSVLDNVDIVIDAGANYGQFILYPITVERAENIQSIFAFEPNPKLTRALQNSISKSNLLNKVELVDKGVSNKSGQFEFYINLVSSGGSSIIAGNAYNPRDGIFRKKVSIETIRFDDYFSNCGLDFENKRVAVKIDVEGHDFKAFETIYLMLKKASSYLVVMETTKDAATEFYKTTAQSEEFNEFLRETYFYVTYQNRMREVDSFMDYMEHFNNAPGCIDIVFSSQHIQCDSFNNRMANQ